MSISKLINIMQDEGSKRNPPLPLVGEVVGVNPLRVKTNGITLDQDQMYLISESFLMGDTVVLFLTANNKYAVAKVVG